MVSGLMVTNRTGECTVPSYSMLNLPFCAFSSDVSIRTLSGLQFSLQKNFLFPEKEKWHRTVMPCPSVPVTDITCAPMSPHNSAGKRRSIVKTRNLVVKRVTIAEATVSNVQPFTVTAVGLVNFISSKIHKA